MKRPLTWYILLLLHLVLITGALAGGSMMVYEPDGSLLGLELSRLDRTPFADYRIPGILLLLTNALLPMSALAGMVFRRRWAKAGILNIYRTMHWGWTYSLYTGIVVITWITVQLVLTAYYWMHAAVIFLALLILVFTLLPAHIRYFKTA